MKKLKDIEYVINNTFKKDLSKGKTQHKYGDYSYNIIDIAYLISDFFGDKLLINNNDDLIVITDNWTEFIIKYNYMDKNEGVTAYVKKTKYSNSDTNAIIKFIKAYISPEEK